MEETIKQVYSPPVLEQHVFTQVVGVSLPIGGNALFESFDVEALLPMGEQ
jgi:hypothetical protein